MRTCPKCQYTRKLADKGVPDWQADRRGANFQKDVMGLSGIPTIVIGNRVTMGFDEGQILASLKEL